MISTTTTGAPAAVPTRKSAPRRIAAVVFAALAMGLAMPAVAAPGAGAWLVFDAASGEVVARHNADQAWYPASVTKLMTTWVTLQAIRAGRITPASLVTMTPTATRQPPSKMGFNVGQVVTVDNALKIIMVKSANDVSWALAEAVGGSKDAFVAEMNRQARLLGMTATHFNNPHGLPDAGQVTTARDLGLLARALLHEFPEAEELWHLPGIQLGNDVIRNHNHLIDHFPGADGMKTGFICSSGFNVVASATRGNRRLVAVVLGSRSARQRAELAAELFTRGFEGSGGSLFGGFSAHETLDRMARGPEAGNPVRDVKKEICGPKRADPPDPEELGRIEANNSRQDPGAVIRPGAEQRPQRTSYLTERFEPGPPVRVWVGTIEDAPAGTSMLALAPDPANARALLFAVPSGGAPTATAAMPPAASMGAIRPKSTGGLEAALPPADGKPLPLGAAGKPAAAKPAAKPAAVAARPKTPEPEKPAKPAATKPTPKPVAKASHDAKPKAGPGAPPQNLEPPKKKPAN